MPLKRHFLDWINSALGNKKAALELAAAFPQVVGTQAVAIGVQSITANNTYETADQALSLRPEQDPADGSTFYNWSSPTLLEAGLDLVIIPNGANFRVRVFNSTGATVSFAAKTINVIGYKAAPDVL